LRTFSKAYGLAGLRIGYAMTNNEHLCRGMEVHGYNFPVSQLSTDAAEVAIEQLDYLEITRSRTRERFSAVRTALNQLDGVVAGPTDCCIYMVRHRELSAAEIERALAYQGVIVSRVPGGAAGAQYVRVTIGTDRDNDALISAFSTMTKHGVGLKHRQRPHRDCRPVGDDS
jgi:histidinol-phosphate aminotransferase